MRPGHRFSLRPHRRQRQAAADRHPLRHPRTRRADKVVQSKDTKKELAKEKKIAPVDAGLPDKVLYDKAARRHQARPLRRRPPRSPDPAQHLSRLAVPDEGQARHRRHLVSRRAAPQLSPRPSRSTRTSSPSSPTHPRPPRPRCASATSTSARWISLTATTPRPPTPRKSTASCSSSSPNPPSSRRPSSACARSRRSWPRASPPSLRSTPPTQQLAGDHRALSDRRRHLSAVQPHGRGPHRSRRRL